MIVIKSVNINETRFLPLWKTLFNKRKQIKYKDFKISIKELKKNFGSDAKMWRRRVHGVY